MNIWRTYNPMHANEREKQGVGAHLANGFYYSLTSSSALARLILKCSLSFSSVFASAASDRIFWVDGLKLPQYHKKIFLSNKVGTQIWATNYDGKIT